EEAFGLLLDGVRRNGDIGNRIAVDLREYQWISLFDQGERVLVEQEPAHVVVSSSRRRFSAIVSRIVLKNQSSSGIGSSRSGSWDGWGDPLPMSIVVTWKPACNRWRSSISSWRRASSALSPSALALNGSP